MRQSFLLEGVKEYRDSRQVSILGVIGHKICYRRPVTLILDHLAREDQSASWLPGNA